MAEEGIADTDGIEAQQSASESKPWYRRPSIRTLKKRGGDLAPDTQSKRDARDNDETRLPQSESVHLGGLALTEAFTPSTVSSLYEALARWPSGREGFKRDLLENLSQSRAGLRGGWQNLGVVRPVARRVDASDKTTPDDKGDTNWYLTQRFDQYRSPLVARHAMTALLATYANRLGKLRDQAGVKRFPRRPVREARQLDRYLIRDGLDSLTITSDLQSFTKDLTHFRWGVPEFTESRDHLAEGSRTRPLLEYVPSLRDEIRERAAWLASDAMTTTGGIRASAELRQAIANTTLQRFVLLLSVVAAVIALVGLLIQRH